MKNIITWFLIFIVFCFHNVFCAEVLDLRSKFEDIEKLVRDEIINQGKVVTRFRIGKNGHEFEYLSPRMDNYKSIPWHKFVTPEFEGDPNLVENKFEIINVKLINESVFIGDKKVCLEVFKNKYKDKKVCFIIACERSQSVEKYLDQLIFMDKLSNGRFLFRFLGE